MPRHLDTPEDCSESDTADADADSQAVPEGCRLILLSPLEIHFSQTRIRSEFQDGHTLQETTAQIESCSASRSLAAAKEAENLGKKEEKADNATKEGEELPRADKKEEEAGGAGKKEEKAESAGNEDAAESVVGKQEETTNNKGDEEFTLLKTPFPRIEVTRWRCKLREADGVPRLDPATGLELYSEEECWFTFDNRRLCCLQRAAAARWPQEVRCEVVEVPPALARTRELRKFDTRTFGCNVLVGRRDDPSPEAWSWRASVGLPEEAQPEGGIARQRSLRWRSGRGGARGPGDRGG
eukprot:CAMPEP_0204596598 /NCGR_PEP_ID=MMETSP0661-20131031/53331_1 /ASSEMBLY_ACC=CAM_ASM_000606 /TAXON_ID=109239 /ORGANISM="Alexandrium margalefi, Strain AMGDE01CS-322" /LENGTH=296 /DNA_ID=CAMNT_0051607217 /DNA_START=105 /DNA_END=991 /DNA_ORIENTATION=+